MKRILSAVLCAALLLALMPALSRTVSAEGLSHFDIRLTEPVATYSPDFSLEYNTEARLYTSITWQEDSPGFSAKLSSGDEFKAGLAYKAEIWVRFGDGNYLATNANGDLDAALTVNGKAISSLKIEDRDSQGRINEVTITCKYDPLPGRQISSVLVKGVPTPVAGNMPIYSFSLGSSAYDFYPTAPVVWWDMTTGEEMDSGDTFVQGHKYQVNIWLAANREGGCTFKTDSSGNPQVSATINSWAADKVTKAYEQDGREVIDIRYTFPACQAAHTCAPKLVPLQKQTCVMPGFKAYYECACGKCYEDAAGNKLITDMDGYGIIPADGHKEEDAWSCSSTHHYKKCATCREEIPGTNTAHTPGPEATETAPQKCTVCQYVLAPAKNHTHKLTLLPDVKPTCLATGTVAHYACSGCTALFSDAEGKKPLPADVNVILPALGHTPSDDWSFDTEYHWRTCATCREVLPETKMAHEALEGKCTTCGYTIGQAVVPTQTEPAPTQPGEQEKPSIAPWIIAVVVGVVCFGAGIGAAVIILKKKKQ